MTSPVDSLFPPSPRVVYQKAPLIQVICQLRFPQLLAIETTPPAEFQERIRPLFPFLEKVETLPKDLPPDVRQFFSGQIAPPHYRFVAEDRKSFVALLPDSLSLSTSNYTRWEDFRQALGHPLGALRDIYKPNFFTRIGLRYQDAIQKEILDLRDNSWSALLRSELLGELAIPEFEERLEDVANRALRLSLPSLNASILMQHGLGRIEPSKSIAYMIDFDFFTEQRRELSDAESTLDDFNRLAGRAFRWCITDILHNALEPQEI